MSEPLSAEEIDALRGPNLIGPGPCDYIIRRLLATLDAARSRGGLDVEQLCGSRTWHTRRNHGNQWKQCYHETCRVFNAVAAEYAALAQTDEE